MSSQNVHTESALDAFGRVAFGVGRQHLGIPVGRKAQAEIWPQIVAWMRAPQDGELR